MAYTAGKLHSRAGAPGYLTYTYDAGSDTLATVAASGYFNNSDDDLNLVVDDKIFVQGGDGNCFLRVSAQSSGTITTEFAGGDLPNNGNCGSASGAISVGYQEKDSATASAHVLPTPYAGAHIAVHKTGSATAGQTFVTDATDVTINTQGDRTISLKEEGESFHLVGTSATRWRIQTLVSADAGGGLA